MFRTLAGLSLWLTSITAAALPATPPLTITYAEQSVRLVRDTSIYEAGRGVALQANDMLETAGSAIQLDVGGRPIAIGPASRLYVRNGADLVLLTGWMKVADSGKQALTVSSGNVQLANLNATVTMHVAADSTELFAESADLMVGEMAAGKPQRLTKLPREQFAVRKGATPMKIMPRPPAPFLSAMPRVFMEPLAPLSIKGAPLPPTRKAAATYADLAPWLAAHPALRQQLQKRFTPPRPARPKPAAHLNEMY